MGELAVWIAGLGGLCIFVRQVRQWIDGVPW